MSVYWVGGLSSTVQDEGVILKVPVNGGAVVTLATGQNPASITIDDTSVYWTNYVADGGVMKATPK